MVRIKIQPQEPPRLRIFPPSQPTIRLEAIVKRADGETYDGEYEVTPTRETQILRTAVKIMSADVIVHPIPPNYGLITYNGFGITVS